MVAYAGLVASLLVSFALHPQAVLGRGLGISVGFAVVVLMPVYFAGLTFARSFAWAEAAGPAIGASMLGAVLGGWAEYSSMAVGISALALLALAFYLGSLLCLVRAQRVVPGVAATPGVSTDVRSDDYPAPPGA